MTLTSMKHGRANLNLLLRTPELPASHAGEPSFRMYRLGLSAPSLTLHTTLQPGQGSPGQQPVSQGLGWSQGGPSVPGLCALVGWDLPRLWPDPCIAWAPSWHESGSQAGRKMGVCHHQA